MLKKQFVRILNIMVLLLVELLTLPVKVSAEFTPSNGQAATLVLGQSNFTSSSPAHSQTGMNFPTGVTVDPTSHKVFVADQFNNRVLRFSSVTALSNGAAAEAVLGQADFTSHLANRGGAIAANTMYYPYSVSVDSGGRLWVADSYNHRILRFDNASTKIQRGRC
jgi:DNA-binding beta-propeller fold protein YncE